jgi:hypothetical protein
MRITEEMLTTPNEDGNGTVTPGQLTMMVVDLKKLIEKVPYAVFPWDAAPYKYVFNWNGGDEDWMIITKAEPEWFPRWLEVMDAGESPDVYVLDELVVYVASH